MKKILTLFSVFAVASMLCFGSDLAAKESFAKKKIKNLEIDLVYENLNIERTSGNDLVVKIYSNSTDKLPSIELSGNTLSMKSYPIKIFNIKTCSVIIEIPEDCVFQNADLKTVSGNIDVDYLTALNMRVTSTSGFINCEELYSDKNLLVKNTSGKTIINQATAENLKLNSVSGLIEIHDVRTDELKSKTTSGDIYIEDFTGEYLMLESVSGKITADKLNCENFDAKTVSGAMDFNLVESPVATTSINTTSGRVKINIENLKGFDLELSSTSGTFYDDITGNSFSPRGHYKNSYLSSGALLRIKTVSGSIYLSNN